LPKRRSDGARRKKQSVVLKRKSASWRSVRLQPSERQRKKAVALLRKMRAAVSSLKRKFRQPRVSSRSGALLQRRSRDQDVLRERLVRGRPVRASVPAPKAERRRVVGVLPHFLLGVEEGPVHLRWRHRVLLVDRLKMMMMVVAGLGQRGRPRSLFLRHARAAMSVGQESFQSSRLWTNKSVSVP